MNAQLGQVAYGNKPTDDGNLIVEPEDYDEFAADPFAAKYLRPFIGARELLHGGNRSCLWLTELIPDDLRRSALLRERVEAVRDFRLDSRAASTRDAARTAQLFRQISQPKVPYLAIPAHVSEARQYFLAQRYSPDVICSNANFLAPDPDGLIFAVLSSSMFMTWQRTVGGRIKSDLRFNKLLTYNTFPLPRLTAEKREEIVSAAAQVIAARDASQQSSLAIIYNEIAPDLAIAHVRLDEVVNALFDVPPGASEADRQGALFDRYARLQRGGR